MVKIGNVALPPSARWVAVAVAALLAVAVGSNPLGLPALAAIGATLLLFAAPSLAAGLLVAAVVGNVVFIATNTYGIGGFGVAFNLLLVSVVLFRTVVRRDDASGAATFLAVSLLFMCSRVGTSYTTVLLDDAARETLVQNGKDLLIGILLAALVTTGGRLVWTVRIGCLAAVAVAAITVVQFVTGTQEATYLGFANAEIKNIAGSVDSWRASGPLPDPNFFGQLLVIFVPLTGAVALRDTSRWVRGGAMIGLLIIGAAIYFTFSRGALLALMTIVVLTVVFAGHRILRWLALAAILAGMAGALAYAPEAAERLASLADVFGGKETGDPAIAERRSVLVAALRMISDQPLLGVGYGQYEVLYPAYAARYGLDLDAPPRPHNLFLEILAEGGLVSLVTFLALVGAAIAVLYRSDRIESSPRGRYVTAIAGALMLSLAGYLVTALFLHGAFLRFFWMLNGFFFAFGNAGLAGRPSNGSLVSSSMSDARQTRTPQTAFRWVIRYALPVVVLCTMLGGVAALVAAARSAAEFEARQTLLYRFGRQYFPIQPSEQFRNWGENVQVTFDNAISTEINILSGREVLRAALRQIEPAGAAELIGSPAGTPVGVADVRRLVETEKHLRAVESMRDVRRLQGTSLVAVSFRASSQGLASELADKLVAAYVAKRQEIFNPDLGQLFERRLAELQRRTDGLDQQIAGQTAAMGPSQDATKEAIANLDHLKAERSALLQTLEGVKAEQERWKQDFEFGNKINPTVEVVERTVFKAPEIPFLVRMILGLVAGAVVGAALSAAWLFGVRRTRQNA